MKILVIILTIFCLTFCHGESPEQLKNYDLVDTHSIPIDAYPKVGEENPVMEEGYTILFYPKVERNIAFLITYSQDNITCDLYTKIKTDLTAKDGIAYAYTTAPTDVEIITSF